MKGYSIVWKQYSKDSDLGKHLEVSEDFSLPYFIDGDDKLMFEESNLNELTEIHLLRGILVGYFDEPPMIDTEIFKSVVKTILIDLKEHFKIESIEKLILNMAAFLRKENGDKISFKALLTGTEICPESSQIKFDCCTDLYNQLVRNDFTDKEWGKKKLNVLLNRIDKTKINPAFLDYFEKFKNYAAMKDKQVYLLEEFESEIKSFEEHLFGITLYYDTTPKLLRWSQKSSYNNITRRIQRALSDAKNLLNEVQKGSKPPTHLQKFNWPTRWRPMEDRIELLLKAYKITFFDRPMTRLSKSEIKKLRNTVMKII